MSPPLCLAAAQCVSIGGELEANVATHARFVARAAGAGVELLVFPELSLTGYELSRLRDGVVGPGSTVLAPLREAARATGITVIAGAPVAGRAGRPRIGAITFSPDGGTSVYCKQYLHPGEERFVEPGELGASPQRLRGETCALAICADTSHREHPRAAADAGATLYLAGVLLSEAGHAADAACLRGHAARHGLVTVMANHGGPSGGYVSAGRSAIWAPGGALVAEAPGAGSWLVIASRAGDGWSGELLPGG